MRGEISHSVMPEQPKYVHQVFTPHVYSAAEIRRILRATFNADQGARRTIPPQTMRALIVFLYGTGATLLSCIALRRADLVFETAMVTLTNARGCVPRRVPLNAHLARILCRYLSWKSREGLTGPAFFVQQKGNPLTVSTVGRHFRKLLDIAECTRRDGLRCRPRLYDFRATFAVQRITAWIRDGEDLGRKLPALAAYMGQVDLTTTERFLALSPERFRKELDKLSPIKGPVGARTWTKPNLCFREAAEPDVPNDQDRFTSLARPR
ncbi:MAG: tyrosine-type recombinase/integrase [Janthinobacterium lividum]